MEIKDITIAQLREHRQDLVEQLTGTDAMSKITKEAAELREALKISGQELTVEKNKVVVLEGEKKALVLSETIAAELKAAKIDPSNKAICTEAVMTVLRESKDADARKPILALMATAQASTSRGVGSQGIVPLPEGVTHAERAKDKSSFMARI